MALLYKAYHRLVNTLNHLPPRHRFHTTNYDGHHGLYNDSPFRYLWHHPWTPHCLNATATISSWFKYVSAILRLHSKCSDWTPSSHSGISTRWDFFNHSYSISFWLWTDVWCGWRTHTSLYGINRASLPWVLQTPSVNPISSAKCWKSNRNRDYPNKNSIQ